MIRHTLCKTVCCIFLRKEGNAVSTRVSTSFWTPHSARAFLPSCTEALGVPKEERDYWSGWSARGSDTYSRVAVRVNSNFQRLVNTGISRKAERRCLGARGDHPSIRLLHVRERRGVGPEERSECFEQLGRDSVSIPVAHTPELAIEEVESG